MHLFCETFIMCLCYICKVFKTLILCYLQCLKSMLDAVGLDGKASVSFCTLMLLVLLFINVSAFVGL